MRVIIEAYEEDFTNDLPAPPNTVRDAAHLEQFLLEGLASPVPDFTLAGGNNSHVALLDVRHGPVGAGICGWPREPSAERSKPRGDIE